MQKEKSAAQLLQEKLTYQPKHAAIADPAMVPQAMEFAKGYMAFLDKAKTERAFTVQAIAMLEQAGYTPFTPGTQYAAGEKVYLNNRGKSVIAATIGTRPVKDGVRIIASHIDSPRLDLKPNPLYEDAELALFKTHYYGGIRKYQWTAIPLSMHGVVVKKGGETVEISIGEKAGDPVFVISDLLPHLSATQNQRTLPDGIRGEELNVICGGLPFEDDEIKNGVKLRTLQILNEQFGITEGDFHRAEIEFVPAFKAADVGFDRSLVGAYGQDDRICAYPSLMAEIETKTPTFTSVSIFTDKEEIGSSGNTGLRGAYLANFITYLAEMQGANVKEVMANSKCLSADVNAGYDPTFPDVMDPRNSAYLNHGAVLTKYTGSRGKSSSNDASAEYVSFVADIFDEAGVLWQVGELGKVDQGGGGTVAAMVAELDIDTVDIGAPILSMHAPYEISSKIDTYMLYKGFLAFLA
ncbi:aminopeptidase [Ruminococcaceae bacterium OttesenSCG-928-N02]|nr:aminopeptidase [Ruminococcaceae bacterium OttesenSCG-928-N02]